MTRTARTIVMVPAVLLGGSFIATGLWADGPAAGNAVLAMGLGGLLLAAGLVVQLAPVPDREGGPPDHD